MGVYHYCATIYFGSIGQQTREIGTNVTFLGITQCSYLSKWVIFGGKSKLFCTKLGVGFWTQSASASSDHGLVGGGRISSGQRQRRRGKVGR